MATEEESLKSSKSFQNCAEADVPGYNDCPTFLFRVSNKKTRSSTSLTSNSSHSSTKWISNNVRDVSGNTKTAVVPPPLVDKRKISSNITIDNNSENEIISLNKEEILSKIDDLYTCKTKLSEKEFAFYQKKVTNNVNTSLNNDSTQLTLSQFFDLFSKDKQKAKKLMMDWMISDTSIGNWCPAFLKIIDNIE